jgi:hypothetical protein
MASDSTGGNMKTLLAFVIACLFWPSAANAQGRSDREQACLIGPVKSVETYSIYFVMKDGKIEEAKREPRYSDTYNIEGNKTESVFYQNNWIDKYLYTYDTKGRCAGYEAYKVASDKTLALEKKRVYTLDDNGNTVEDKIFNPDGGLTDLITHKYDSKGNEVEEAHFAGADRLMNRFVFTYDERGNRTSFIIFGPDDTVERIFESVFDNKGNIIEELRYLGDLLRFKRISRHDEKGRVLEEETTEVNPIPNFREEDAPELGKVVYAYDDKKRTKEAASHEPDGSLKERIIYTYDEKRNEIGKAMFKADGSPNDPVISFYDSADERGRGVVDCVTGRSLVEFEYDSHGNWTRKIDLIQSGKDDKPRPTRVEERVITYH